MVGGPQGRSGPVRKILTPPGFDPRTVQPVASRYTYWAIPDPVRERVKLKLHHDFLYNIVYILHCPRLASRLRQGCRITAFVEVRTNTLLRSWYHFHYSSSHSPDNKCPVRLMAFTYWSNAHRLVDGIQWKRPVSCGRYRIVIALPSSRKLCRVRERPFQACGLKTVLFQTYSKVVPPNGAVVCTCPHARLSEHLC